MIVLDEKEQIFENSNVTDFTKENTPTDNLVASQVGCKSERLQLFWLFMVVMFPFIL